MFSNWQTFSHFFYHKWRRPDCMLCSGRVYIPRAVAVLRISGPGIEITCGALVWSIYIFSCDFFQFFLRHWAPPGLSKTQGLGQWPPGSPGPPKTATVPVQFWVFPPVHAPKYRTWCTVLFEVVLPTHTPNHTIPFDWCHTSVKALFVEPLSPLSPMKSIVLALLSQLPSVHAPQFGDDSLLKTQRMQIGV